MYLAYKKIKKHNEKKKLQAQLQAQQSSGLELQHQVTNGTDEAPLSQPQPVTDLQQTTEKKELSPEEKAEKKRRNVYRWKVILGLFAPFCLQSLDTTIIASALPYIAQDFRMPSITFKFSPSKATNTL